MTVGKNPLKNKERSESSKVHIYTQTTCKLNKQADQNQGYESSTGVKINELIKSFYRYITIHISTTRIETKNFGNIIIFHQSVANNRLNLPKLYRDTI